MSCFGAGWTLFIICAKLPFAAATSHIQANDIAQHITTNIKPQSLKQTILFWALAVRHVSMNSGTRECWCIVIREFGSFLLWSCRRWKLFSKTRSRWGTFCAITCWLDEMRLRASLRQWFQLAALLGSTSIYSVDQSQDVDFLSFLSVITFVPVFSLLPEWSRLRVPRHVCSPIVTPWMTKRCTAKALFHTQLSQDNCLEVVWWVSPLCGYLLSRPV